MKRLIQSLAVLMLLITASASAQEKTLFFSQYIEGSSQNKAMEIYNPTADTVFLDGWAFPNVSNTNSNPGEYEFWNNFPEGAFIAPGDVYVIAHPDADAAILAEADYTGFSFLSNGNDGFALVKGDSAAGSSFEIIDMLGSWDGNSDDGWDVAGVSEATKDHTLVRKAFWESGNPVSLGSFGTTEFNSEWIVLAQNDFTGIGSHTVGGPFTIRDANTYRNLTEFDQDAIAGHPLVGEEVTFTAVIVSYPRSSGLATPNDTDNDGITDDIGRLHMFVTDTSAISMGRAGMSIQIVEGDYELVEGFTRGDVVTFTGDLGFFNSTAQFAVETVDLLGNVNNEDFSRYADLLNPWEVSASEINVLNPDGTHEINIANYGEYNGAYVKINNAVVSNVSTGDRPNWAITENNSRIYVYDTSLRYRNDRPAYIPTFNYRRAEDGEFVPPAPGAVVNLSGFVNLVGDNPDGNVAAGSQAFSINPFEDGVVWLNEVRFVDGQDLGGGATFSWPNDVEVLGLPPVFSNVMQSDSSVTSSDAVTVSATVVGVEGKTVTGVDLVYTAAGVSDTLAMTANGDVYSATIPAQPNFTAVTFFMIATDSDDLTGRGPLAGNYSYFVQDGAINTISLLQETGDGRPGPSPLAGAGVREMNITGTIVSDANDGVIVLQDSPSAWGGIFLEQTSETSALNRGDEITITAGEVIEADVASNSLTLTQLVNVEFTTGTSGNDLDAVIPVIHTDSIPAWTIDGEIEPYEGMVVKFEDVQVTERGIFGEYTVKNVDADSADGAQFNEDIRSDAQVGSVGVPFDINHSIRLNKTMDAYAIVAASFGVPKFHPRDVNDFIVEDDNIFTPVLDFSLVSPEDGASIEVTGDVEVSWTGTTDFDGDDVTYAWVLYAADTSSVVVELPSNTNGEDAMITIAGEAVDALLADAGLAVGESANFVWNVLVSDGSDTLMVHGSYGNFGDDFAPIYRSLTLTRGVITSDEIVNGVPTNFALEQNYPNPFNPSTNINFALPQTSKVTLTVYDMLGRKVATLINGEQLQAANHSVKFDASALASGMYIYRIEAGSFVSTRKMMLIK
ncbi:MAG: T9SS type A sorting domain-containing protein [bacterium]|nr:T9SS type A sorting domain-containing protein [bacterium]